MTSQRRSSLQLNDIPLSQTINHILPNAITSQLPGLHRENTELKLTYFCNICFINAPMEDAFILINCQHQFCVECIKQFIVNKIDNGVVNLNCFHPLESQEIPCGNAIDEDDIKQLVDSNTWDKFQRFKSNLSNTLSRQCPTCNHTQIGDPNNPIMICESANCHQQYCLYHSNAHDADMPCEAYELSTAKENKMNLMAINELGDQVKPCPQCNFRIIKMGGCNHMKCVKCSCSFCWICKEIIEDTTIPEHYRDPNSKCRGQQFAGMEDYVAPPRWLMYIVGISLIVFAIPSMILGIVVGFLLFPVIVCRDVRLENGEKPTLFGSMLAFTLLFLVIFVIVVIFLPIILFKCIIMCIRTCLCCWCCPPENIDAENTDSENIDATIPDHLRLSTVIEDNNIENVTENHKDVVIPIKS